MDFASTPAAFSPARDPRQNNFDLLRFLFASLVVFSHSYSIVVAKSDVPAEPLAYLSGRQISLGTLSVYGFFAISGFLIAQSWTRSRSFGDFFRKRALRLYPGFAVMTVFCALLVVPLAKGTLPPLSAALLGKIAYRVVIFDAWDDPSAFPGHVDPGINASAWTIPYEFWCYLLLAGIAAATLLRRRWGVAILFVAVYALLQLFTLGQCGPIWADLLPHEMAYHASRIVGVPAKWPEFLTYFLAGTLFFRMRHRIPHSSWIAAASVVGLAIATRVAPLLQFVLPIAGVYLLFWLAFNPALRFGRFGARGDFSYGIYLYAFPIQQLLIKWVGPARVTPMQLFMLAMPLALLAGILSWHGVEKWFVHRRGQTKKPASAQEPVEVDQAIAEAIGLPGQVVAGLSMQQASVAWEQDPVETPVGSEMTLAPAKV